MRSFALGHLVVGAILLLPSLTPFAHAATWTGLAAPDNNWTTAGNWDSGVPGSGETAIFDSAAGGNTNISLGGAARPINSLLFDTAGAAAYTIGQLPGDTLDFDDSGLIFVDGTVTTPQTIQAAVEVNGSGLLVTNNVSNGGADVGNGVIGLSFGDVAINSGTLFVTNGADGTAHTATAFNGDITGPGSLHLLAPSGGGSAAQTNNNFILSGNNTYTGGTHIEANTGSMGSIQIDTDSPFGTGKVTSVFQGNSVEFRALGSARTIANDFDLEGGLNFAGDNDIVMGGDIAIASGASRTLNSKTASGAAAILGASPGSSLVYLGNPVSNGGDGLGRIVILQAQSGATLIVNALFQDVGPDSHVRYGSATGGNIIINSPQTYTSETQLGSGSATVQFKHDYNMGDPSGPFGLGTLVANGAANVALAPIEGDRTIANPFRLDFGFTVENVPGDDSSVTFTGPIKFNSTASRLIQNKMGPEGGMLILGDPENPNVFELSGTPNLTVTFHNSGRTIVNDAIQDASGVPNNLALANNAHVTFNGPQNSDGSFDVAHVGATAIINGDRTGSGPLETEGLLIVNGSKIGSGAVTIDSTGTLAGTGSLEGDVANSGTIAPGDESLTPGTLTLSDNVTNLADSRWLIGLNGATAGRVDVGGNLDLSAIDNLDVVGSGTGPWVIATYAGTLMGTFDNVTSGFAVDYGTPGQIVLSGAATLTGDYNNDGSVDAADYVIWRKDPASFGGEEGYNDWRANFGNSAPGGSALGAMVAVPEPATMALLLLANAGLAASRPRRRASVVPVT